MLKFCKCDHPEGLCKLCYLPFAYQKQPNQSCTDKYAELERKKEVIYKELYALQKTHADTLSKVRELEEEINNLKGNLMSECDICRQVKYGFKKHPQLGDTVTICFDCHDDHKDVKITELEEEIKKLGAKYSNAMDVIVKQDSDNQIFELFYANDEKAIKIIGKWLEDNHYFDELPEKLKGE